MYKLKKKLQLKINKNNFKLNRNVENVENIEIKPTSKIFDIVL